MSVTISTSIDIRDAEAIGDQPRHWRGPVNLSHAFASAPVLGGAVLVAFAWPDAATGATAWGGAALLVGGALIGVPHGSSDFVVAHRALRPKLGRGWLPRFLIGYLATVALVLLAWLAAPLATLLAFVALSCLHFGHGDLGGEERGRGLALAVRATTPLLPVLLAHPSSLTGLIALLGGVRMSTVERAVDGLGWPLLMPWALAVSCYLISHIVIAVRGSAGLQRWRDVVEVGILALAAVTLPPLLVFALYFCLVHAVRHMIGIADQHYPHDARRAAILVGAIVVPSATVCLVALGLAWTCLAGPLGTEDVLAWSLRLIAALTVPHMALEAWAERSGG